MLVVAIQRIGAPRAAVATYIVPIFGVAWAWIFLFLVLAAGGAIKVAVSAKLAANRIPESTPRSSALPESNS